jgi:hypothetical protein
MNYEKFIFVDFENINNLDIEQLDRNKHKLFMLVASAQNRLPFDIVKQAHDFTDSLEWIKVEGSSKNDLDMHFSFLLGECHRTADDSIEFLIFSKDKDHSSKVSFIKSQGRKCRKLRKFELDEINSVSEKESIEERVNGNSTLEYAQKIEKDELKPMKIMKTFSDFDVQ